MPSRFVRDVLVPGWILTFGLVSLAAPPQGAAMSIGLFLIGAVVVPALILIPVGGRPAPVVPVRVP
jgi:hypothetical protein